MASNQDTLEDRLRDEEYKNWLKSALCLFCVKEGLESFAEQESDALHQKILAIYKPCGNCTQVDNQNGCSDCKNFKLEIKKWHKFSKPSWNNTDVTKWLTDHWSVARCFMNPGQSQHTSASDADISALLNFIIHCNVFQDQGTYGHIQQDAEKVREHRNDIFHREKDKLQKKDLDDWTKNMIQLLKNKSPVGKLKSNTEAQKARKTIKKVLDEEITITLKDENKIQIAALEAQMAEVKSDLQGKAEKLQTLQNDSTSQDKRIQTLQEDFKNLKPTLDKIQEKLVHVRAHPEKNDEEMSKIIVEMKDKFKSVWDQIYEYNRKLEKLKSDLKAVQSDVKTVQSGLEAVQSDVKTVQSGLEAVQGGLEAVQNQTKQLETLNRSYEMQIRDLDSKVDVCERRSQDKVSCKDLTGVQKAMIASYKPHQKIQLNPVFLGEKTSRDVGDFYTNMILEEGSEDGLEGKRGMQQKKTEHVNSFRQLFEKNNVRMTRIVLKGEAGLGKSTFIKKLLKTWCTFKEESLNKGKEVNSHLKGSSDEMKDGDFMLKFDILLYVNLGKISDEKDFLDVIYKQIPVLNTPHLSNDNLVTLMEEAEDNKVLMIMDALDEMDACASCAPYIEQIVKGEKYPTMTVLVASRPWKIDKLQQSEPPAHIDLLVDMKGFSPMNSKLFAGKIFKDYYEGNDESDMEQFWHDIMNNDIAKMLIHVPLLLLFLVNIWHQKQSFPKTVLQLYLKMLDILVNRDVEKKKDKRTKAIPTSLRVEKLKECPKLQALSITKKYGEEFLLAWCEVASQFLFDEKQGSALVFDEEALLGQLGEDGNLKLQTALEIGLLCKSDCTTAADDERKVRVSFPHMTIQELLAAIHLCCTESHFSQFLSRLKTYHDVFQNEIIITFIAGISSQRGEEIFEKIFEACDDEPVYENIKNDRFRHHFLSASFCKLYMKCVMEAGEECKHFRIKHLHANSLQALNTVVSHIKNIRDIQSLSLESISFRSDQSKAWLEIFKCDNLRYLVLKQISLDHVDWNLSVFPGLLRQCTHLQLYDINLYKLDLSGASCLSELILVHVTISSISLSQCTQLQKLILSNVHLVRDKLDLSVASCLSELWLDNIIISSISVSQSTRLQKLTLNKIRLCDGKLDLSGASCLSEIGLYHVTISSISLSQCTQLQKLTLYDVDLGDGKLDLSGASCLSELSLNNLTISSISLSQCTQPQKLTLNTIKLADGKLDLSGASCLSELQLDDLTISSISLSQCTKLQKLMMYHVNIGDGNLDLLGASCLSELSLNNVTISSISLSQCTQLQNLRLWDVNLGDGKLNISGAFWLENVTISSISRSQFTQLQKLSLCDVNLGDGKLDLSDAPCLSELWLNKVTLSGISLSQCTKLQKLTLLNINLGECKLDLSCASCLYELNLYNITISNISLSQCTKLQKLTLCNINLGECKLDLSGASCLYELVLVNVTISSISLSQCTQLQKLRLDDVNLDDYKLDLSDASCLSKLRLENVTISNISRSQCTQLQNLTLHKINLGDGKLYLLGASCLSEVWLYNVTISSISLSECTQVENLVLDRVNLGDGKLGISCASCLSELGVDNVTISGISLSQCTHLHNLTLCNINLGDGKLDLSVASCLT